MLQHYKATAHAAPPHRRTRRSSDGFSILSPPRSCCRCRRARQGRQQCRASTGLAACRTSCPTVAARLRFRNWKIHFFFNWELLRLLRLLGLFGGIEVRGARDEHVVVDEHHLARTKNVVCSKCFRFSLLAWCAVDPDRICCHLLRPVTQTATLRRSMSARCCRFSQGQRRVP